VRNLLAHLISILSYIKVIIGQINILDYLATYMPTSDREAESVVERITPRLQHANSAVALSATKVILKYLPLIDAGESANAIRAKIGPPLVTLLSSEYPEVKYIALRNLNLIVQKDASLIQSDVKVSSFFCV
jgi:AP-1 complex subunit beta-1